MALVNAFEIYLDIKLVIIAHLYGTSWKSDEIEVTADKHGAMVLVAVESLVATYKGK